MSKLSVGVDLDGIVVDLLTPWLTWYNQNYHDHLEVKDVTYFDMDRVVRDVCGPHIYHFLSTKDLFKNLKPIPGAVESLNRLSKNFDLYIVSAFHHKNPQTAADKLEWVREYLPFIDLRNVILTPSKGMVCTNVLIDDGSNNLKKYKSNNPQGITITIDYPYNRDFEPNYRALSYKNYENAWREIVRYLEKE